MFQLEPFYITEGLKSWLLVLLACGVLALFVGLVVSVLGNGLSGFSVFFGTLSRGFRDLTRISSRRVFAIASLTFKESHRRKAFLVGVVFLLLFMFAGWFLQGTDLEKPAKPYISFVLTAIKWLLVPMALLVSCWGLPADIKDRSLHTVVTKPVRRSEVVLGRMLGYSGVLTLVLVVVGLIGYVWITRQVPPQSKDQLIARVPVYGTVSFLNRDGVPTEKGINVGYTWEYRSYIEGLTNARAIWKFDDLNVSALESQDELRIEQKFEAFRTFKGDVGQQVRYTLTLVNPSTDLKVLVGTYPVHEFSEDVDDAVVVIPRKLTYRDSYEVDAEEKTADLFDDLMDGDSLTMEVGCVERQQYLGVAQPDLFIRMPDRPFAVSYAKAVVGLWLMMLLVVFLGTSASCFLKGPVATLTTFSLIILGQGLREYMREQLDQLSERGEVLGGGTFESMYRLVTQMNVQTPLPEGPGTAIIKFVDARIFDTLRLVEHVIPNFNYFDMDQYTANGFDVPWNSALLPSLATTIAFLVPLILLGYFSLQLRELESK